MESKGFYMEQKAFLKDLLKNIIEYDTQRNNKFYEDYKGMFKAQFVLMLYTTLEAVVAQSIQDIFDHIQKEKFHFSSLNKSLQRLYIKSKIKNKEKNFNQILGDNDQLLDLFDKIKDTKHIFDIKCKEDFKNENPFKAGSLNINNIQERVFKVLGIDCDKDNLLRYSKKYKLNIEENITNITNARNQLAHGEKTFENYGRDIGIETLKQYYLSLHCYLTYYYFKVIERYLNEQEYKI